MYKIKTIKSMMKDEKEGIKKYKQFGIKSFERDETKHLKYWKKELKKKKVK